MGVPMEALAQLAATVMIVDDDEVSRESLGMALEGHFATRFCVDGNDCLAQVRREEPDLILLDIEMPGLDGYDTCRRLLAERDLPVMFISMRDSLEERIRAYDVGAIDFIVKPADPDILLRKAGRLVAERRRQRQINAEKRLAEQRALDSLADLGKASALVSFLRERLDVDDYVTLADRVIENLRDEGVSCLVQIRSDGESITRSRRGDASPLEESVIENTRHLGEVHRFQRRMIVNFGSISILVLDVPGDPVREAAVTERARLLAECAEGIGKTVGDRRESIRYAEVLQATHMNIDKLKAMYREQQAATRFGLYELVGQVERTFDHLGLGDGEERRMTASLHAGIERLLDLFDSGFDMYDEFEKMLQSIQSLKKTENDAWLL